MASSSDSLLVGMMSLCFHYVFRMVSQVITGVTAIVTGIAMWQTRLDCIKSK